LVAVVELVVMARTQAAAARLRAQQASHDSSWVGALTLCWPHMKILLVGALIASCTGGTKEASPAGQGSQYTETPRIACRAGELVVDDRCVPALTAAHLGTIDRQATRLEAVSQKLAATEPVERASQVLAALHQLDQWKRRAAAAKLEVIDIAARLHEAQDQMHALGALFASAARMMSALHDELAAIAQQPGRRTLADVRALVSTRITAMVLPLGKAIPETIAPLYQHAQAQLVEEIAFLNERVCVKDDPALRAACKHEEASAAYDYIDSARGAARHDFDDAGAELEAQLVDLLDARSIAAIDRATGRGPSFGEPCGLEGLCAERLECQSYTSGSSPIKTCEFWCRESAEQQCLHGTHCTKVEGLDRRVCRP
jgi:hypothetical protein